MAFKEAGSWKVGPDDMYTLSYDPADPDNVRLDWQGKCFMTVAIAGEEDASEFSFDESDLRWMECYRPWLAAVVVGKNTEENFFEKREDAVAFARQRQKELKGEKPSFYVTEVDGGYYYEDGKGYLKDKVDPSEL